MPDIVTRVEGLEAALHDQVQTTTAVANAVTRLMNQGQTTTATTNAVGQIVYRVQDIEVALRNLESAAESLAARLDSHEEVSVEDDALKHLEGVL